jgi:hypothetical protein
MARLRDELCAIRDSDTRRAGQQHFCQIDPQWQRHAQSLSERLGFRLTVVLAHIDVIDQVLA